MDCTKTTARRDKKPLSFWISCVQYYRLDGISNLHCKTNDDLQEWFRLRNYHPWGIWCRGWTTCLLCDGSLVGLCFYESLVGLQVCCRAEEFSTHFCSVCFFISLFLYTLCVFCTYTFLRRSLDSFWSAFGEFTWSLYPHLWVTQ